MDLMTRRRAMMTQALEPETWDYELYPADGSSLGQIACLHIPVQPGYTVEIKYKTTSTPPNPPYSNQYTGYVYDARRCGGTVSGVNYLFARKTDGETVHNITIQPNGTGSLPELVIACVNTKANGYVDETNRDCFYGYYIKVKVTT